MTTIRHRAKTGISYNGLDVHAPPGVHQAVDEIVAKYLRPGDKIIELGAGSGAFTARLLKRRFDVDAVDFDASTWTLPVQLFQQDLNVPTWDLLPHSSYNAVVAIEVIEHLENPSNFLRNCKNLLLPDGLLILTTPNVTSVESKRKNLLTDEFSFFGRGLLFSAGHRNILPYWLLEDIFSLYGFEVKLLSHALVLSGINL